MTRSRRVKEHKPIPDKALKVIAPLLEGIILSMVKEALKKGYTVQFKRPAKKRKAVRGKKE